MGGLLSTEIEFSNIGSQLIPETQFSLREVSWHMEIELSERGCKLNLDIQILWL